MYHETLLIPCNKVDWISEYGFVDHFSRTEVALFSSTYMLVFQLWNYTQYLPLGA